MAYSGFRHPKRLRGDVVSVLNRLVREGVVASYQTNFPVFGPPPDQIEITVTGRPETGSETEVQNRVSTELATFSERAAILVRATPESSRADRIGRGGSRVGETARGAVLGPGKSALRQERHKSDNGAYSSS